MDAKVFTLGCRLNQVESDAILEKFAQAGFGPARKGPGICIINSCTVTSKAEQKMRRMAREMSRDSLCIVTGCAVKGDKAKEIEGISPNIVAVGIESKSSLMGFADFASERAGSECSVVDLVALARKYFKFGTGKNPAPLAADGIAEGPVSSAACADDPRFAFFPTRLFGRQRAYLKVQDGCDRHCSFCAVPLSRGDPASLELGEVVRRFKALQDRGFKEICLTGVNLALYGHGHGGLGELLFALRDEVMEDVRVRLTSLEPDLVDERLLQAVSLSFVAPFFHLPIQSAAAAPLALTGRKYDSARLEEIISALRDAKGDPFISADIISGLPGEEDAQAEETYAFLERNGLSMLHVFPFSKREGTAAWDMKAPEQRVRDERARRLRDLSARLYRAYALRHAGCVLSGIVESVTEDGGADMTTDNYLKVRLKAEPDARLNGKAATLLPGQRRFAIITEVKEGGKRGALVFGRLERG